jgi:cytochrome c
MMTSKTLRTAERVLLVLLAMLMLFPSAAAAADASHGEELYQGCQDCHSLDTNDVGPMHRGVFGRKAGSVADYSYSASLKSSGITWDEQSLDRWLTDPRGFVPGAKMFYHLDDAKDRADVIEYLKERAK